MKELKITKVRLKNCNCSVKNKSRLERVRQNLKKFFGCNIDDILFEYDTIETGQPPKSPE
jgi:hypothetical protein